MSYTALVCKIHTRPHPNADRLLLGTANGYQVVVGIDTVDGQLGVFFGCDGQLSEEMCEANDLIGYTDPETHERKGGFFAKNRRVRSQKLRGEKSDGFWTSLDSLRFTGVDLSTLREGDTFTELNGVPICNKYYTPATLKAMKGQAKQRKDNICFPKHIDTKQLKHYIDSIPEDSVFWITEKLHGTSGRFGYVPEEVEIPNGFFRKLFRRPAKRTTEYRNIMGTRNVVLADHKHEGFYGNEEFRWNAVEPLVGNMHKGEVFYFELVGYTTTGAPIMSTQSTTDLKDKLITKLYGDKMLYKYGCPEGTCELYVYRITRNDPDGVVTELSWPQVKQRCRELGIKHVPELFGPEIHFTGLFGNSKEVKLQQVVEGRMEGPSTLDSTHIREGVVLRVEMPNGETDWFKAKSFTFGILEGYLKDEEDYVDMEESA
jgi:hypothetical protein